MWQQHKRTVLDKSDKSFKGSIDAPILDLVTRINESESCFTTSSCSGRIMLVREKGEGARKNNASFVVVSHDYADRVVIDEMLGSTASITTGHLFLKLEPVIIHIECETLDKAIWLLHRMKRENAFKHTSIVSAANSKYVVSIRGVVKMEVPIVYDGVRLCTDEMFIKYIEIANTRMEENFSAILKLTALSVDGVFSNLCEPAQTHDFHHYEKLTCCLVPMNTTLPECAPLPSKSQLLDELCLLGEHLNISYCSRLITSDTHRPTGIIPDNGIVPSLDDNCTIWALSDACVLINTNTDCDWWLLCAAPKKNKKWGNKFFWKRVAVDGESRHIELLGTCNVSNSLMPKIYFKSGDSIYHLEWSH